VLVFSVILMNGQSRGSLTLKSRDPAEIPVIETNYLSHPYDRRTLIEGVRTGMEFSESPSMGVVKTAEGPSSKSDEDIWVSRFFAAIYTRNELMTVSGLYL